MSNWVYLPLALLLGSGLGIIYFGGLWLTVRLLPQAKQPVLLSLVSFVSRISISLIGFYRVSTSVQQDAPLHLLACLVGFFWIRNILVQRLQPHPSLK
ncbi:MAG TPA: ATP synthase subunit I [Allocoleopsis sp.]